jgi:hypothetical protein
MFWPGRLLAVALSLAQPLHGIQHLLIFGCSSQRLMLTRTPLRPALAPQRPIPRPIEALLSYYLSLFALGQERAMGARTVRLESQEADS